MSLAVDEHHGQVHIVAGERLFGDCALGVGEQRVQLALEVFECTCVRRFVFLQQGAHTLGEVLEHSPHVVGSRFVGRGMGYFHLGQPSTVFS